MEAEHDRDQQNDAKRQREIEVAEYLAHDRPLLVFGRIYIVTAP
jgi:hypothetical protein